MDQKIEPYSSFEDWGSSDDSSSSSDSSSSNDVIAISKSSTETDESSYKEYIREFYESSSYQYVDYDEEHASTTNSQAHSNSKSDSHTASSQSHAIPVIAYPTNQHPSFSSNKESTRHARMSHLNNSVGTFRRRSQYYADRDLAVKRYLGVRNQLNAEDQERFAHENKNLHKLAMKHLEYENRPSTGERIKQGFKALGENISNTKQRIGSWWQGSSNNNENQKHQSTTNDYKSATAEQNRNARYNDYKNASFEQQGSLSKRRREQDYNNSIQEQLKFIEEEPTKDLRSSDKSQNKPLTKQEPEFLQEQALGEKELEQKAAQDQLRYEKEIERLNEKFEIEQSQHRLDEIGKLIKSFAERPTNELPKIDAPNSRQDVSDYYLDDLDDFSFSENNQDDPFTHKECALGQDENWTKSKNVSTEALSSVVKDFEKSAVDFLTTGRHESKHIDPKIVNEIINDPATPKNIVKLLEHNNSLQNSTNNKELRDLSITTTELLVYAETLSRKIAEDVYKTSQEEARLNNAIKDKIIDVATNIGEYIDIALEELKARRNENIERPIEAIKSSVEAAGHVAMECGKLAVLLIPTEHMPLLKNLSPEDSSTLEKKSLEEMSKIIHTVEQNFSEFKNLPPQEQFRSAVRTVLNAASLILVAKTCSQVLATLRTSAAHVNDLKGVATTAEEMATLESSAQLISQEQKLVHAVEQAIENNLTQASEHIPGAPKFNQKDALAKEFAESETGKKIGARLEKSASEKAKPSGSSGNASHSAVEVETPEAIKNFNPANQNAIKEFPKDLIKNYKDHIFSKNHRRDGILRLGANESEIINKITDIILETDQVGLIKPAEKNVILTVIQGKDVIIRATLNESGKIISMNGYLNTSSTIPSNGNVVRYISEKYK